MHKMRGGKIDSHKECKNKFKCVNCNETQWENSKNYPIWRKEKGTLKIKCTKNIMFLKTLENTNYAEINKRNLSNTNIPKSPYKSNKPM